MAEGVERAGSSGSTGGGPIRLSPALKGQKTYGHRFRAAYVVLAFLFWGAVGTGTILLTRDSEQSVEESWSAWKPTSSGLKGAEQIAARVASQYRLDDAQHSPLGLVSARAVDSKRLAAFEVGSGDGYTELQAKHTLLYVFCGFGRTSCALPGRPTQARSRLLRREALELALYTFKYVRGFDSVLAVLPPAPNTPKQQSVLLFRSGDLKTELGRPLALTISTGHPVSPSQLPRVEALTVERLTEPHWFNAQGRALTDGTPVMVLDPVVG
jgi:hypothetical protein